MSETCPECGREFDNKRGLGNHMSHQHDGKPWIPKDEIERLYFEEGCSQRDIADRFDTQQRVVQKAMRKYGLESEKSRNDPTHPPQHTFQKNGECVGTEYEQIQITIDNELYSFQLHRLIAVAYGKLPPSDFNNTEIVVHHDSGHGLDNRPENLEVMSRGDHQTHHLEERYS